MSLPHGPDQPAWKDSNTPTPPPATGYNALWGALRLTLSRLGAPPRRVLPPVILGIIGSMLLLCVVASDVTYIDPLHMGLRYTLVRAVPSEKVIYQDSLKRLVSKYGWSIAEECPFKPDGFHVVANVICFAPVGVLDDATITVTATQLSGATDRYKGICFRFLSEGNFYVFEVDELGDWYVGKVVEGTFSILLSPQVNTMIYPGTGVANSLTVKMRGGHFVFSANGFVLGSVNDSTFALGGVGLGGDEQSDMLFTDMTITEPSA